MLTGVDADAGLIDMTCSIEIASPGAQRWIARVLMQGFGEVAAQFNGGDILFNRGSQYPCMARDIFSDGMGPIV